MPPDEPNRPPPEPDRGNMTGAPLAASAARALLTNLSGLAKSCGALLNVAFKEWLLTLVRPPQDPPFHYQSQFEGETNRVVRLVVIVIIVSLVIIGGTSLTISISAPGIIIKKGLYAFLIAILVSLVYRVFAFFFRLKITWEQILFTVLFMGTPWMPVYCFLWSCGYWVTGTYAFLLVFFFYLSTFAALGKFGVAISIITGRKRLSWLSLIVPIILVIWFIVFR